MGKLGCSFADHPFRKCAWLPFFPVSPLRWTFLRNLLSSPWPDHCRLLSLLKEKNIPFVPTAKVKTRELFPTSPLCRLVNKPPCFTVLSWLSGELFAKGFLPCLCCVSFFSLFIWLVVLSGPLSPSSLRPSYTPQTFHLCHVMIPENFPWSLFYFICLSNPFSNIILDFFSQCYCSKI